MECPSWFQSTSHKPKLPVKTEPQLQNPSIRSYGQVWEAFSWRMVDGRQATVGGATPGQVILGVQASKLNQPMRNKPISSTPWLLIQFLPWSETLASLSDGIWAVRRSGFWSMFITPMKNKWNIEIQWDVGILLLGIFLKESKAAYNRNTCNKQVVESVLGPTNRWMDKKILYIYSEVLLDHKKRSCYVRSCYLQKTE